MFRGKKSARHVHAKTGYIRGVSALSGYVERGGRHWIFSVLVNGIGGNLGLARSMEEGIAEEIYRAMGE